MNEGGYCNAGFGSEWDTLYFCCFKSHFTGGTDKGGNHDKKMHLNDNLKPLLQLQLHNKIL